MSEEKNVISFRASDGNTVKMEYRESLPSTARIAKEYALAGYPDRYVIFTERQTAVSATGATLSDGEYQKGLFLSCILRPSIFPAQAGPIGPFSALSLAVSLEEHSENEIGIGWGCDVYCNGEKIGCTSIESKVSNNSYDYLIITFSAKLDSKSFPPRLTDMVRQVFAEESISVPMIMAKTVLNKFFAIYKDLKNPEKHLNNYINKFILQDKKVKYFDKGRKKTGKIVGIDKETLALLIEAKDGREIRISSSSGVILPKKI